MRRISNQERWEKTVSSRPSSMSGAESIPNLRHGGCQKLRGVADLFLKIALAAIILLALFAGIVNAGEHDACLHPTVIITSGKALGSGVIVKSVQVGKTYRNTALTVAHVASEGAVTVWLPRYVAEAHDHYDKFGGSVTACTPGDDLAVISFDSDVQLPVAAIGGVVQPGQPVHKHAGCRRLALSDGRISVVGDNPTPIRGPKVASMLRLSMNVIPGDSGGPIYRDGRLVGIVQSADTAHSETSWAVPIGRFNSSVWR